MCVFVHVDTRCGHMLSSCFGIYIEFGVGCVSGENFFLMVPHVLSVHIF
jgi:hypothetical protein